MTTDKYLVVTVYDNDFTATGRDLGKFIQTIILNNFEKPEDIIELIDQDKAGFIREKIALFWATYFDIEQKFRRNADQDHRNFFLANTELLIWGESDFDDDFGNSEFIVIPLNTVEEPFVF